MDSKYQEILRKKPCVGSLEFGEVQMQPPGHSSSRVGPLGVVYQDSYVTVLREQVLFPSLSAGTHLRIIPGDYRQEFYGVVILAVRPRSDMEPEILMLRQWRHPVQGWMTEIPRGTLGSHEIGIHGAVRELQEEAGLHAPELLIHLGDMAPDSGISSAVVRYYLAMFTHAPDSPHGRGDSREAISSAMWTPMSAWHEMRGAPVDGRPVGPLDAFTASAIGLAYSSGAIRRVEIVGDRVLEKRVVESSRLGPEIIRRLDAGEHQYHHLAITFREDANIEALRRYLPLAEAHLLPDGRVQVPDASTALVCWLTQEASIKHIDLDPS